MIDVIRTSNSVVPGPVGSGKLALVEGTQNQFRYISPPTREDVEADLAFSESLDVWNKWRQVAIYEAALAEHGEGVYDMFSSRYSPRYWVNILWVARNVPPENRAFDHELGWAHYQAVAPVKDKKMQYDLLYLASQNGWSASELERIAQDMREEAGENVVFKVPPTPRNERAALHMLLDYLTGKSPYRRDDLVDVVRKMIEEL